MYLFFAHLYNINFSIVPVTSMLKRAIGMARSCVFLILALLVVGRNSLSIQTNSFSNAHSEIIQYSGSKQEESRILSIHPLHGINSISLNVNEKSTKPFGYQFPIKISR